jgi:hypothetical protein
MDGAGSLQKNIVDGMAEQEERCRSFYANLDQNRPGI